VLMDSSDEEPPVSAEVPTLATAARSEPRIPRRSAGSGSMGNAETLSRAPVVVPPVTTFGRSTGAPAADASSAQGATGHEALVQRLGPFPWRSAAEAGSSGMMGSAWSSDTRAEPQRLLRDPRQEPELRGGAPPCSEEGWPLLWDTARLTLENSDPPTAFCVRLLSGQTMRVYLDWHLRYSTVGTELAGSLNGLRVGTPRVAYRIPYQGEGGTFDSWEVVRTTITVVGARSTHVIFHVLPALPQVMILGRDWVDIHGVRVEYQDGSPTAVWIGNQRVR